MLAIISPTIVGVASIGELLVWLRLSSTSKYFLLIPFWSVLPPNLPIRSYNTVI